ncbi:hypothetical protein BDD43_3740 [Mucilaginibacter gracilis]|uniref:O-antigen ligase-like membrane protein n=1 Tax=Mucilaginibacter gracilis TaxID=423350 RepID=A0A495J3I6_9SPHI|nr:hypothetical protein [Mucilaginibacter gracilis]RKR83530.1 hypothetical protein BDD43_3740 [Mucilaginibacter gracilis]
MGIQTKIKDLKQYTTLVDWKLLAFLVLFLDVKIAIKIMALMLIYLLQFDFKLGFSFKNSRLPLFYLIAIAISIINWIIYKGYASINYNVVFLTGIGFWLLCVLAIHQVKLSVERNEPAVVHRTILLFFILNAVVSGLTLLNIICEIHTINPYRYQGNYQKYFIGTGDYIKGITFDVSTTNAVLNAFGVIYFLSRKNVVMVLACMAVLLLTGSNTINLMLVGILTLLFIVKSTLDQKSVIVICLMLLAVFMFKISPQNDDYIFKTYYRLHFHKKYDDRLFVVHTIPVTQKPDSVLSPDERKQKIAKLYLDSIKKPVFNLDVKKQFINSSTTAAEVTKPDIPVPSIHTAPFQHVDALSPEKQRLLDFVKAHQYSLPTASLQSIKPSATPGKVVALGQTLSFLQHYPQKALTGNGIGNFSSKLAFKVTGLGNSGGFPAKYDYINPLFLTNHLDVYLNFFSRADGFHSLINSPNSVYDQLLSEYGLIGLLAFAIYYLGYFLKHYKSMSYGVALMLLMCGVFFIDYWFEQLSVIVFFELLMLVDIKQPAPKTLSYAKQ